ncbi:MAG: hypothetical protein M1524_04470 [Patescibacteria group bacterium]|nr:hypothetical protein [Patescibacteria group bacterium]
MKIVILSIVFFLIASFFVSRIFLKPNKTTNTVSTSPTIQVSPTPQNLEGGKITLKKFTEYINSEKTIDAVSLLSEKAVKDEKSKDQWQTNFNSISKISLAKVEDFEKPVWTENFEQYKVMLDIELKPGLSESYGWIEGENIRWVTLEKDNKETWRITEIATGP